MALTKLTKNLIDGNFGTEWVSTIQTSNFTAAAGKGYFVNTTSQVLYVTLPVGVVGTEIVIQDYAGTFATNKVVLIANGSENIQGSTLNGRIQTKNATATLVYQDATQGWTSQDVTVDATTISWATPTGQSLTYSTPSPIKSVGAASSTFPTTTFTATKSGRILSGTASISGLPSGITASQSLSSGVGNVLTVTLTGNFTASNSIDTNLTLSGLTVAAPPITVSYLAIAGGGSGGGNEGGGGGAGGLRTSYPGSTTGGGGGAENTLTLVVATNYLVTIGAGGTMATPTGSGAANGYTPGGDGSNSVFASITSTGGGGGGTGISSQSPPFEPGRTGGSGGGGSRGGNAVIAGGAAASPTQGYAGGASALNQGDSTGGGGGAGALGVSATGGGGFDGGVGLQNSITGTTTYYAGGGGGGGYSGSPSVGSGGNGGGGDGLQLGPPATANEGAANTGGGAGGGGGSGADNQRGGASGGSGIVIIRYPNSVTISGLSGSTINVGTDRITTFTSGTGNIQFN